MPAFRYRGKTMTFLRRRVLRRLGIPDVSQARIRQFLAESERRTRPELPATTPRSLTIVVPAYAHAGFLPDALESIVAQTRLPNEVVLVDDCSPDATRDVFGSFMAAHGSQIRRRMLVNEHNLGQAASLNRGIAAASGELVMILNDDDYLMHDAVESMLDLFGRHPEVALIGANNIPFAGHAALAAAPKLTADYARPGWTLTLHQPSEVPGYRYSDNLNMTHSGLCFRKVAWEGVGGYRPDRRQRVVPHSDRDFQIRVNALWPVAVAESTPFSFWRSDSSVDQGRNS